MVAGAERGGEGKGQTVGGRGMTGISCGKMAPGANDACGRNVAGANRLGRTVRGVTSSGGERSKEQSVRGRLVRGRAV